MKTHIANQLKLKINDLVIQRIRHQRTFSRINVVQVIRSPIDRESFYPLVLTSQDDFTSGRVLVYPVYNVLKNVAVIDVLIVCVVIQPNESCSLGNHWQDSVAKAFHHGIEYAAFNEPLLRIHEEFLHQVAVSHVVRQSPTNVASAAIAQSIVLIARGRDNAHMLAATVIIATGIGDARLREWMQGFYSFGVAYLKRE